MCAELITGGLLRRVGGEERRSLDRIPSMRVHDAGDSGRGEAGNGGWWGTKARVWGFGARWREMGGGT